MIITVLRSRLNPETVDEYRLCASRTSELAVTIPGYISHKGFIAEDGERVTVVEFLNEEGLKAWATHMEHVRAKRDGRQRFFTDYRVQVCKVIRDSADRKS